MIPLAVQWHNNYYCASSVQLGKCIFAELIQAFSEFAYALSDGQSCRAKGLPASMKAWIVDSMFLAFTPSGANVAAIDVTDWKTERVTEAIISALTC